MHESDPLQQTPPAAVAILARARGLLKQGRAGEAESLYREVLAAESGNAEASHLLGVIHLQRGDHARAVELIDHAIALQPSHPGPHSNRGIALHRQARYEAALDSFNQAIRLHPGHVDALVNRGNTLRELGRAAEALDSYEAALRLKGDSAELAFNRANALKDLARLEPALAGYDDAVRLKPGFVAAHVARGNVLRTLHRQARALTAYDSALAIHPDNIPALIGRGNALSNLRRLDEALECYDRAQRLQPDAIEILNNRGSVLRDLKRYAEAAESFGRLAQAQPDFPYAHSNQLHSQLYCCDWKSYNAQVSAIIERVDRGEPADVPFSFLAISDDAQLQLKCAQRYVADFFPPKPGQLPPVHGHPHGKIRVAYLSADFREHAVSYLAAGLFERHDRSRFEVTGLYFGPEDRSPMRQRLEAAFDRFVDVRKMSDLEVASLMRELEIDIAVDLMGFTNGNRAGVLAYHAAPLQVGFLGFPGGMGAPYLDYLVADARLIPHEHQDSYSEKLVYMPDSYQVNDGNRAISPRLPSRQQAGLPEHGFVFCCFNNSYKITPSVFYSWMRLLRQVPGSVLWLLHDNEDAVRNLRSEANRQGVAPERLVFATRMPLDEHLARHKLADLFLDTLPYNAHTTASDALWAGLPVVTCMGNSFAARVAGSLLAAVDLPELITHDPAGYEALALKLATTPAALAAVTAKLARNRLSAPLFDTDRFRRHIESAYSSMWQRHRIGHAPATFAVPVLT